MNCRKVTHLLSAYMDGELPGVEHRLIHEHLTHCADCLADYEDLLQMKRLLGRMRMQSAQSDLPIHIISQIHAEERRTAANQPTDWMNSLLQVMRTKLTMPQTLSLGLGFAVVAMLYLAQPIFSSQHSNDLMSVTWQERPVNEFINDVHYADSERFLSRPTQPVYQPVSSEQFFPDRDSRLFQPNAHSVQIEQLVFHPR